jgi:diguanylate cyclase (GGDEF)-like protein/PAS domain S-box-containing protein
VNLLIVDDDAINRKLLRAQLEAEGHHVLDATNGIEALQVLHKEKSVDGVVSDILMPDMDGFQLCLEIRKNKRVSALPFIFYTSTYSSPQDQQLAKTVGADNYLSKPSPTPVILAALHEAAQRTRPRIAAAAAHQDDTYVLKQYNAALVRKLEQRNIEVEEALKRLQNAHEAIEASEERFRQITENIREVFWLTNPTKNEMLYVSPAYDSIWGRPRAALYQSPKAWLDAIHPEDRERVLNAAVSEQATGTYDQEYRIVRPDGTVRWIRDRAFPVRNTTGEIYRIAGVAEDITERKLQEQKIEKLSRIRAVSSEINAAIVRIRDREALLRDTCRIAAEHGKFELIWIGEIDTGQQQVRAVVWEGFPAETANRVSWSSIGAAQGTLGEAIQTRKLAVRNDIGAQLPGGGMRGEAVKRGYRSSVCLPLVVNDSVVALIVLFAIGTSFFDTDECALLEELTADVSFALQSIAEREKVEYLSYYDPLTALPNRSLFVDRLNQQLRGRGGEQFMVAVVLLNIERFRYINETLGRNGGDELLKLVAQRLASAFHGKDYISRLGADGFGVMICGVRDTTAVAHALQDQILNCFHEPFRLNDNEWRVAAKAGAAVFPADGDDADTLFKNAEAALKKARESGDRYLFYAADMNARAAQVLSLETCLRRAVENREFVLHYQPKYALADGKLRGMEALIRWQDPASGLVAPAVFIPLLEETGLILEVGRWALGQALEQYREWTAHGYAPPRVAVNVSAIQLQKSDFSDVVIDVVQSQGDNPDALELEVTESLLMKDVQASIRKLSILRGLGITIAMDDFGTGYSSLAYLARLPINSIKIDRSFVIGMTGSPQDMGIVTTIIGLAHSMKLKVVAEGVETEEQSSLLKLLRCDEAQGYLFSKPLPAEEIKALLPTKTQ